MVVPPRGQQRGAADQTDRQDGLYNREVGDSRQRTVPATAYRSLG